MTSTTPTEPEALAACPFCGSDTAQTSEVRWNPVMTKWAVVCVHGCDMQGPPADDEAGAIKAWNHRAADDAEIELRERKVCAVCSTVGTAEHLGYCSESI